MRVSLLMASLVLVHTGALAQGPETIKDCSDCPEMVVVPSGSFEMGAPDSDPGKEADEGPVRTVTFAGPFAIGKYEITVGEYAVFAEATGKMDAPACLSWTDEGIAMVEGASWKAPGYDVDERSPVACVSWRDAESYTAWLSAHAGEVYRLPTEAEWEYAARGGTTTPLAFPGGPENACRYGNLLDQSAKDVGFRFEPLPCDDGVRFGTAPVGSYLPNGFGLHDTVGNLWEWVLDCYHDTYDGAPTDGSAFGIGSDCGAVLDRGGGFSTDFMRSANRSQAPSLDLPVYSLGFRVVRELN